MATIYALRCLENGFAYIGCTGGKLGKRMREHRCLLKANKHSEPMLLSDWQQFGEERFSMETLEILPAGCSTADKRRAELLWMDRFSEIGKLYNRNRSSFQGAPGSLEKAVQVAHATPGNRWTPDANLKRRLAQLGKPKGHGAKISATKRAKAMR
jgi:group I intron endonuclease